MAKTITPSTISMPAGMSSTMLDQQIAAREKQLSVENVKSLGLLTAMLTAGGLGAYAIKRQLDAAAATPPKRKDKYYTGGVGPDGVQLDDGLPKIAGTPLNVGDPTPEQVTTPTLLGFGWDKAKNLVGMGNDAALGNGAISPYVYAAAIGLPLVAWGGLNLKKLIDKTSPVPSRKKLELERLNNQYNQLLAAEMEAGRGEKMGFDAGYHPPADPAVRCSAAMLDQVECMYTDVLEQAYKTAHAKNASAGTLASGTKQAGLLDYLPLLALASGLPIAYYTYNKLNSIDPATLKAKAAKDAYHRLRRLRPPQIQVVPVDTQKSVTGADALDSADTNVVPIVLPRRNRVAPPSRLDVAGESEVDDSGPPDVAVGMGGAAMDKSSSHMEKIASAQAELIKEAEIATGMTWAELHAEWVSWPDHVKAACMLESFQKNQMAANMEKRALTQEQFMNLAATGEGQFYDGVRAKLFKNITTDPEATAQFKRYTGVDPKDLSPEEVATKAWKIQQGGIVTGLKGMWNDRSPSGVASDWWNGSSAKTQADMNARLNEDPARLLR